MSEMLGDGVLWAALLVLIVDRVVDLLRRRGIDLAKMARYVEELHEWHSVVDPNGVRVWYVRGDIMEHLKAIRHGVDRLEHSMKEVLLILRRMERSD